LSNQALGSLVSRSSPEITVIIKKELVDTSVMWKERVSSTPPTKNTELANLSVTSCAEYDRLSALRFWVKDKALNAARVALEGLQPLTTCDIEHQDLRIGTTRDEQVVP
jgi:hypothetical protein